MELIKGMMLGAIAGMAVGVVKSQEITGICRKCKKTMRKMKLYGIFN